jgi:histidine phosphotransferase ChpT
MAEAPQRILSQPMTQGMSRAMPSVPPLSDLRLARLVGLRLCHDISGVAGTVGNALELLDGAGGEAAELAVDAAAVLRRRLLLWRALLGGQGESALGTVLGLATGEIAGGRASADAAALDAGIMVAEEVVPVLLTAVLLAGEALPRGGVVRLVGDPHREMAVLPEGPRAAWPPALLRAVAGAPLPNEPTGREVLSLWLAATAAAGSVSLSLAMPPGEGCGPLLLSIGA